MMPHRRVSDAWSRAVSMHAYLSRNGLLRPVDLPFDAPPALLPEEGECAVGVFAGGMTYARYYATDVYYSGGGPRFVMGSRAFVAGAVVGSLVMGAVRRRQARRIAEPQWRPSSLRRIVITTRRLWCEVIWRGSLRWLNFDFDAIAQLNLRGRTLTLSFMNSDPLQLGGEWIPWCAAVIAHCRYGTAAGSAVPELTAAAVLSLPAR